MTVPEVTRELERVSNAEDAVFLQRYFKTGPGEYGEGDRFRGIRVPALRNLTRKFQTIGITGAEKLLRSKFHEDRLLALMILTKLFESGTASDQSRIYRVYLRSTRYINNWDLVDCSAGRIVGGFLHERDRAPIYRLAASRSLWERRIAVLATSHFIRRGEFDDTLKVASMLLNDKEDLIHKAVGWMLREIGNKSRAVEEKFLRAYYTTMPRTMLRYAIEKFPERDRQLYLKGKLKTSG